MSFRLSRQQQLSGGPVERVVQKGSQGFMFMLSSRQTRQTQAPALTLGKSTT